MRTTKAAGTIGAVALAMVLGGCATTLGRNFDDQYAQQIKSGETTKGEVLGKLGRPALRRVTGKEETWTYAYYTGPGLFGTWFNFNAGEEDLQYGLGKQIRLVVVFQEDVVKTSRFTQEIPIK